MSGCGSVYQVIAYCLKYQLVGEAVTRQEEGPKKLQEKVAIIIIMACLMANDN